MTVFLMFTSLTTQPPHNIHHDSMQYMTTTNEITLAHKAIMLFRNSKMAEAMIGYLLLGFVVVVVVLLLLLVIVLVLLLLRFFVFFFWRFSKWNFQQMSGNHSATMKFRNSKMAEASSSLFLFLLIS
jgi:hypothetical protein